MTTNLTVTLSGDITLTSAQETQLVGQGWTPPAPPVVNQTIVSFSVSPTSINAGQSATLSWVTSNGTAARINGSSVALSGSMTVTPASDTSYVLELDGAAPTVTSAPITLTVIQSTIPPLVINRMALNKSAMNCLRDQSTADRYDRMQWHTVFTTSAISALFGVVNLTAGGARLPFGYPKYGLLFNGNERATYTRVGTEVQGTFTGTLADEPDGPIMTQIVAYDATGARVANPTECMPPYWVWIDRNGGAKDAPFVVYQTGSFEWDSVPTHAWALVPKSMMGNPTAPIVPRTAVDFATALPMAKVARVADRIPVERGNTHIPCVTSRGITITENMQSYYFSDMSAPKSNLPLIDGPRGVATCAMVLFARMGRNAKVYHTTPFSFRVVDATGAVRTLAGQRHTQAPYWLETPMYVETVGNWDASIPEAERFPWESWGQCWDERSLALDPNAAPIGGEQPHIPPGPVAFVSDRHGYVLKLQFDGSNHATPAVITRFIAVDDPWGLAYDNGLLYVAERAKHRISAYDATTGAFVRDVVVNPGGANFAMPAQPHEYRPIPGVTQAAMDGQTVVAPELIDIQDGYLYYCSLAMGRVKRVNLSTGAIELCTPANIVEGNSHFMYLTLGDGTFGPRGTIFTSTFSNAYFGRSYAWVPGAGAGPDGVNVTHATKWIWSSYMQDVPAGAGGYTQGAEYAIAVAVGQGRMVQFDSNQGIQEFMQADPALDPTPDYNACVRGATYWRSQCYELIFGMTGYGHTLYPLPWGENPDCDYYLTLAGHTKPV